MIGSFLLAAAAIGAVTSPAGLAPYTSLATSADVTQQFADCAVKKYEGAELLATQPGSPEEAGVLSEYGRRACAAPAQDPQLLRGAVAEQLFKNDFGSIGARLRRDSVEIFTVDVEQLDSLDAESRRRVDLLAFGTCIAAADPTNTVAVLNTPAGSTEESGAISALQPVLSPCLAAGEQLNLKKPQLRGALAEGAYRLALAHALDDEILVTGTKDPGQSVVCKMREASGTRFRRKTCLTLAQWSRLDSDTKFASEDIRRRAQEYDEMRTLCVSQAMFSDKACMMQ